MAVGVEQRGTPQPRLADPPGQGPARVRRDWVPVQQAGRLQHRHPLTPYAGQTLTGRVRQAWLRGTALLDAESGAPDDEPVGRLLNRG